MALGGLVALHLKLANKKNNGTIMEVEEEGAKGRANLRWRGIGS